MLEIGQIIKINGNEGQICFLTSYEKNNYANICFNDNGRLVFKIYKYEIGENSIHFILETDENAIAHLMAIFTEQAMED